MLTLQCQCQQTHFQRMFALFMFYNIKTSTEMYICKLCMSRYKTGFMEILDCHRGNGDSDSPRKKSGFFFLPFFSTAIPDTFGEVRIWIFPRTIQNSLFFDN